MVNFYFSHLAIKNLEEHRWPNEQMDQLTLQNHHNQVVTMFAQKKKVVTMCLF